MDFFLDTGIFVGCDPRDKLWYCHCNAFYSKYARENYYTTHEVETELERKMIVRRKQWKGNADVVLRSIEQLIIIMLKTARMVNYKSHPDYSTVIAAIRGIIPKTPDDIIVANAMVWSYDLPLDKPTLVTVDIKHMINNKARLKVNVESNIRKIIPLDIDSPANL